MCIVETRLLELGVALDTPKPAVANCLGTKQIGDQLFVSGRKSELMGEMGKNISVDQAKNAARETILAMLSIIKADIGDLDKISGVKAAQARGDFQVLSDRNRRTLHIHLGQDTKSHLQKLAKIIKESLS